MPAARLVSAAAALCAALAALPAGAVTCFVVLDRNDNVIYRDALPPVDLSDAGKAAREAMRARGEFMMFHEVESCPRLEFFTGGAGTTAVRLDQALAPTPVPAAAAPRAGAAAPKPK